MPTISIIKKTQLQETNRLDAEYYQPKHLETEKKLCKLNSRELGKIAFVTDGEHGSPIFDESSGIIYLSAQNVKDNFFDLSDVHHISVNIHKKNKRSELKEGNIILSIVGTIGNAAVVSKDMLPGNTDRHVATIIIEDRRISPHYVSTFLNSKYGKCQSKRLSAGNVQPLLNLGNVRKIMVPILKCEQDVENLRIEAIEMLKNSQKLYEEAENLLLEELGLKDFKPKYDLSYIANLCRTDTVHRIDAEYFQPTYYELIEYLNANFTLKPLGKLLFDFKKGIEVGSENYQEEGKPFIRVSNLSANGFVERDQKYISEELYEQLKNKHEPRVGDLLLTKDATPGIAYVTKEPFYGIIASGILRLTIKENKINKEYLAHCINSIIGKLQIERDVGGSVIKHWMSEKIKRLQIPVLPKSIQQKIASLVQQFHEARKRAKELLEEAKGKVEEAIEKT